MSYEFYTSDLRATITTEGSETTWGFPTELWHGPVRWGHPYTPVTPYIPVIQRKPKSDPWEKYTEGVGKVREIEEISEVTKHIVVRPVIICGWCGARIARGKEEDPCEYCGS